MLGAQVDPFIRLPTVRQLVGLSTAAIYRRMRADTFPRPVTLGPNSRAWRLSEIRAWQAERVAARDDGSDAGLRSINPNIGHGRQRRAASSLLSET
jgi:prophage regulatory protein